MQAAPAPVQLADDAPPAIESEGLSVSYRVRIDGGGSTRADLKRLLSRRRSAVDRMVPALRDVSFAVPKGSVLAVIGRNGAGKSTLLRVVAGILPPEAGRVVVRGRLNLLAIGLGLDPNLSGRENIRLGGLAFGIPESDLAGLTAEIAAFAQLDEYIEYPMKSYSSGMKSRLGFSIAAHLDPEILLIDEAMSAGDAAFSRKASERMAELAGQGRTIVLVTHGLTSVRSMASQALWLHQGHVEECGDPDEVVAKYMRYCRLESFDGGTEL